VSEWERERGKDKFENIRCKILDQEFVEWCKFHPILEDCAQMRTQATTSHTQREREKGERGRGREGERKFIKTNYYYFHSDLSIDFNLSFLLSLSLSFGLYIIFQFSMPLLTSFGPQEEEITPPETAMKYFFIWRAFQFSGLLLSKPLYLREREREREREWEWGFKDKMRFQFLKIFFFLVTHNFASSRICHLVDGPPLQTNRESRHWKSGTVGKQIKIKKI